MNEIQIFNNPEFGEIRTININNEPWFVLKDLCAAFGDQNYRRVASRLEDDEKGVSQIATPGGNQNMTIVNESGLYSTLFAMQPEKARGVTDEYIKQRQEQLHKFKRWVTSEVLPSIRKHGGYIAGQEEMSDAELMAKALMVADRRIKEKDQKIQQLAARNEEMRPKELFADSVAASSSSILIGELAKILRQNGVDTGEKRLFEWMRNNGYLIRRKGTDYNMPTQRSMEMKLFEIKETVVGHASGHTTVSKTPKVTGKGQQYFINIFLG